MSRKLVILTSTGAGMIMDTAYTRNYLQNIITLLHLNNSPEGDVLEQLLLDLLEVDPCEFHYKVPRGYNATDCYLLLVHSALLDTSLEAAGQDLMRLGIKVPLGEAVLDQLRDRNFETLVKKMDMLFYHQWQNLPQKVRDYLTSNLIVCFDTVRHPYYGNIQKAQVVGGKKKASAAYHYTYASAQLLWEGHGLTLAVRMLSEGQERMSWTQELIGQIKAYGRPCLVLGDGEFWFNEHLEYWYRQQTGFIFHACGAVSASKLGHQLQQNSIYHQEIQIGKHTIHMRRPKRQLDVRLIAWPGTKEETRCIGVPDYLDELPAEWAVSFYRSRFGIETGYRLWNKLRPRTTSRNSNIRYILVTIGVALYNAYSIVQTSPQLPDAPESRHWKRLKSLCRIQKNMIRKKKAL